MWEAIKAFLRSWGLVVLATLIGMFVAFRFVSPAPPDTIRLAVSADPQSAYTRTMDAYARALEAERFRVERVPTQGSVENLRLLREGRVDLALMQGGVVHTLQDNAPGLVTLGAVFYEPAWMFIRAQPEGTRPVQALRGKRVAVGPEGSGTRVLALSLLRANGLGPDAIEPVPLTGNEAAEALVAGQVEAVILVSAIPTDAINRLVRAEGINLLNFGSRADAYGANLPFLTTVRLPEASLSLPEDLPRTDVTLMAPSASVFSRKDINPQVAALMMRILRETHRPRSLFAPEGRFPNGQGNEVPLQEDAQRFYEKGASFLQSYLPFWVAVAVDRLWVLLIPLITLLLPLARIAPPIYTWQMERQLYAIYNKVRKVDEESKSGLSMRTIARLDALDEEASKLKLPDSYADRIYALRRHIAWLRRRKEEPA